MSIPRVIQRVLRAATEPDAPAPGAAGAPPTSAPVAPPAGNPAAQLPAPHGQRLNRNALTILAVAAFMGVVTVVVFVQPTPQAPPGPAETAPQIAPRTYLDQPVRGAGPPGTGVPTGPNPATAPVAGPTAAAPWAAGGVTTPSVTGPVGGSAAGYGGASAYATAGGAASPAAPSSAVETAYPNAGPPIGPGEASATAPKPLTAAARRQLAFERALEASATGREDADDPGARPSGVNPSAHPPVLAAGYAPNEGSSAIYGGGSRDRSALATPAPDDPANGGRAAQFLAGAARGGRTVQALTLDPAPGRYTVQAGTVIPAVLMTEINSDLPGECLAQVTRDVFDSRTQRVALIPRGSKLLCKYDDQLGAGQSRLLVAWTRVLFPDGRSIQLPGLPATDQAGARGVADQVDRHTRKAFGTAVALSLLSAGVQLSQPRNGSLLAAPTDGQIAAGALGQQLNSLGVQMLQRGVTNQQTIRIRQGTQFNVFLSTDLVFPGPYAGADPAGAPARAARGLAQR